VYEDLLKAERDRKGIERQTLMDAEARGMEKGMEKGIEKGRKEGIEKGRKEGREEGIEQGTEKRNIEIAKQLLQDGEPIEKIIRWTGLSQAQLNQLQQS
jgi:flagellar biosynthesis/type III secretory pathway protein FliH